MPDLMNEVELTMIMSPAELAVRLMFVLFAFLPHDRRHTQFKVCSLFPIQIKAPSVKLKAFHAKVLQFLGCATIASRLRPRVVIKIHHVASKSY